MKKTVKYSLILITSLAVSIYLILLSSFPVMQGSLRVEGLDNDVNIYRDNEGIPHIDANTRNDMNFALGLTMASDRAFQYEIIARAGQGKLSEILGSELVAVDKLFRILNSEKIRKQTLDSLDVKVKQDLQSFINGYNYYLENGTRPIEYFILGIKPKKIDLNDIYGIIVYLTYSFTPTIRNEVVYNKIISKVKSRDLKQIFANDDIDLTNSLKKVVQSNIIDIDNLLEGIGTFSGSNAWAISGSRTKSGKPILASDPHIKFSAPNMWYEANIRNKEEGFHMYGHFLPMLPFPGMGHNADFGWGLTISYTDDLDLFQMPDDFKVVRTEKNIIKVKGQESVTFDIDWSEKGPIVDFIAKDTKNVAASFAFLEEGNKPFKGFYGVSHAKSFEDVKKAASLIKSPGLNIVYADTKGNVARLVVGDSFIRSHPNESDLIMSADRKIIGAYEFDKKPHEINPKHGLVVSANDRPKTISSDVQHRGGWHSDNRYNTIFTSLDFRDDWDISAQKILQTASFSTNNKKLQTMVKESLQDQKLNNTQKKALDQLISWNGHSRKSEVGATIFNEFNIQIRLMLMDELGQDKFTYCRAVNSWTFFYRLLEDKRNSWWDILETNEIEDRDAVVYLAFKKSVSNLETLYGSDLSKWNWGRVHQLKLPHPFEKNALLSKVFSHGPYPANGSINSINHIRRVACDKGHTPVTGPSTRRLIDFSRPEISYGILPLGNSGHMLSPFYDNQRERFFNDEYRVQILNFDMVKKTRPKHLLLRPAS